MLGEWIDPAVSYLQHLLFAAIWWAFVGTLIVAIVMKYYIKSTTGMCFSSADMTGKTVIVTGANTGIGKETARDLAQRNARVIMACRNIVAGKNAAEEITASTNNEKVVVKHLDLASFRSIRDFAEDIIQNESRLDVLINNAGIQAPVKREISADGYELTFATNHLGPFLLTNLLLDLLKKSAPSRVITVSSLAHRWISHFNLDDLQSQRYYGAGEVYGRSKLANILFTAELAKQLKGTGVTAVSLHPGIVSTEFLRQGNYILLFLANIAIAYLGKNAYEGAQTTIYTAVSPDLEKVTGRYFSDCVETKPSAMAQNKGLARELWEISEELTRLSEK